MKQQIDIEINWSDDEPDALMVTWPSGEVTQMYRVTAEARGLPIPEKTYEVVLELTESEVKARAKFDGVSYGDFPGHDAIRKLNRACRETGVQ